MPMPMSGPSQITRQSERALSFVNPHILDHVLGEGRRMCLYQPKINDHEDIRDRRIPAKNNKQVYINGGWC